MTEDFDGDGKIAFLFEALKFNPLHSNYKNRLYTSVKFAVGIITKGKLPVFQ